LYQWVLRWQALPIQRPGAKMHSAIVIHGPQGTGKNLYFEAAAEIYGEYGRVLGQEAIEDKFNSDWAGKRLFIVADEVLARTDMFHVKNRLKGFVTGNTIRVNPKGIAAHNEANRMNIVFLSNERMPIVLENDDRRHCVFWTPPALPEEFFNEVVAEIKAGGVAALHYHLLHKVDCTGFDVATKPPMTQSKRELIEQSASSEDRFVAEWAALELESNGATVPFCPALGTDLYRLYVRWCDQRGERRRRMQELIGYCNKRHGWSAGRAERTFETFNDRRYRPRKMVVPPDAEMQASVERCTTGEQARLLPSAFASKTEWLTASFFAFQAAVQEPAHV
jgi:putative DNA primase/helicase